MRLANGIGIPGYFKEEEEEKIYFREIKFISVK